MNRLVALALVAGITSTASAASIDNAPEEKEQTYLIPHFIEKQGTVETTPFTVDTFVMAVYTGGLPETVRGNRKDVAIDESLWFKTASLDLYLRADDGSLLRSATGRDVCNPCSFTLSATERKRSIRIDDLIVAAGGFEPPPPGSADLGTFGFAIIVVKGDPEGAGLNVLTAGSGATPTPTPESLCGGSGPTGQVTLIK